MDESPAAFPGPRGAGADNQQIWEFPVKDFLVCARPDLHGLFILNATARLAWQIYKDEQSLEVAAKIFAEGFGIPFDQACEDVSRAWEEWSSGLLSPAVPDNLTAVETNKRSLANGSRSLLFSAIYSVLGQVIRLQLFDNDITWDLVPRVEPFRVNLPDQDSDTANTSYPDTRIDVEKTDDMFHVFVNGLHLASEMTVFATRVTVLQEFLKVSGPQPWAAVLHAGACGADLRCVVFPGASHSGKTTLAAALIRSGMEFYGDDSIPLEQGSLTVQPMPFALMTREGSWPILSDLIPELAEAPIIDRWGEKVRYLNPPFFSQKHKSRATALVFTQYKPAAATSLKHLETIDALVRLNESGFWLAHDRSSIASFLDWLEALPCYSLVYSDLTQAVGVVQELLTT